MTADDPPVYLAYNAPPALGQPQKDATHTANFGVKLQERCNAIGVRCELAYPEKVRRDGYAQLRGLRLKRKDGTEILLEIVANSYQVDGGTLIQLNVSAKELAKRRRAWQQPRPRYTRGLLAKYTRLVSTASRGAVTDTED